jgi:hypothetical protein
MHFVIIGRDRPGQEALRLQTRPSHRDYIHGTHQNIVLVLAGPLLGSDGRTMTGSLLVVEAGNQEAVEQFSMEDPYRKAGLFAEVRIDAWNWVTGKPDKNQGVTRGPAVS